MHPKEYAEQSGLDTAYASGSLYHTDGLQLKLLAGERSSRENFSLPILLPSHLPRATPTESTLDWLTELAPDKCSHTIFSPPKSQENIPRIKIKFIKFAYSLHFSFRKDYEMSFLHLTK